MTFMTKRDFVAASVAGLGFATLGGPALAMKREKIDRLIGQAQNLLRQEVPNAARLLDESAGYLMMPRIRKAGFGIGGAYGEGALMVGGAPVQYYSVAAGSFGLQFGVEQYSSALFFGTDSRLNKFRNRDGWTVGADLEYTAWDEGEDADIDNHTISETVYGVVFGQEGLHIGATLEGSKYSTITR